MLEVNRDAPAVASAEAVIRAPREVVWGALADLANWNRWNADVAFVELRGPVAPGVEFRWKAGGATIVSTLRDVEPMRRISWTGRTMGIRAAHVWTFEEAEGGVRVRTEESFEGVVVRLFAGPMRRRLALSLEKGLAALAAESERRAGA